MLRINGSMVKDEWCHYESNQSFRVNYSETFYESTRPNYEVGLVFNRVGRNKNKTIIFIVNKIQFIREKAIG